MGIRRLGITLASLAKDLGTERFLSSKETDKNSQSTLKMMGSFLYRNRAGLGLVLRRHLPATGSQSSS